MSRQRLRGSKEQLCETVISSLEIVKELPDNEIRNGINGVIAFLTRERDQFKEKWIEFETETNLKAKALIKEGKVVNVKLISKVPRGFYYSCLNEAGLKAEELWPKKF